MRPHARRPEQRPPQSRLLTDPKRDSVQDSSPAGHSYGRVSIALPVTATPNGGRRSGYGACRRDPLAPAAPPAARDCDFAVSSCCSRSSATRSVQALCARGADHKFGTYSWCVGLDQKFHSNTRKKKLILGTFLSRTLPNFQEIFREIC